MALKKRDMERVFNKLSIEVVDCKHHVRGYYVHEGKRLLPVYYSFGSSDIPGFVTAKIARSMCLSEDELVRMAKCKISASQYKEILSSQGVI